MEIKILETLSAQSLEEILNSFLKEGWEIKGKLIVTLNGNTNYSSLRYIQMIIKKN
jgi:hypothetical protein